MKVRNISSKIIGIAGRPVMPDEEVEVHFMNPAIRILQKKGFLQVIEDVAEETAAAPKRTRNTRKKKETAAEESKEAEVTETVSSEETA